MTAVGPPRQDFGKAVRFLLTLPVPLILFLLRPLGMTFQQSGILAALVLTILWWVTGAVERTAAACFLLAVFLLFSGAGARTVLTFPLSENFLMIVFSFLFSQGIANSGLAAKLIQPMLARFGRTPSRLMVCMILSAAVMLFIIPQPFSRIIILSLIYESYFAKLNLPGELTSVFMLGLYLFSVLVNMTMLRGDMILNGALVAMSGLQVSEGVWMRYMLLPTVGFLLAAALLYRFVFRGVLSAFPAGAGPDHTRITAFTSQEKRNLLFLLLVVLIWATEGLHPVSGTAVVIAATLLMFPLGLLKLPDLKSVNLKLLVFLTAAFSIGGTLKACGVADLIFSLFTGLFPTRFNLAYVLIVIAAAALLHMLLGSNITTMSVVVPGLMAIGAGVAPPLPLLFLIYIVVCGQFLLPFHHVILLLGEGNGYYSIQKLLRFALPHTVLTLAAALLLYLPWWHLLGFI